jgi:osmoprotectant transport system permease protein
MYRLQSTISPEHMRAMNAGVKIEHRSEERVAGEFLERTLSIRVEKTVDSRAARVFHRTTEHLVLTLSSVIMSVAMGLPLGIYCASRPRLRSVVLGAAGVVQTIPALALLVMFIPVLGIGTGPAVAAMILYALFPVLEGTVTGLTTISTPLRESAEVLGLSWRTRLLRVDLPLASPSVLSGVRTAAVLSVGTATLGAMVGAGGYGQPILTGVRLDSVPTIPEGAMPAAALALLVQLAFRWFEKWVVPRGLRQDSTREVAHDLRALLLAWVAGAG